MKTAQAVGLAVLAGAVVGGAVLLTREGERSAPVQPATTQPVYGGGHTGPQPSGGGVTLQNLGAQVQQGFNLAQQGMSFFNDLKGLIG